MKPSDAPFRVSSMLLVVASWSLATCLAVSQEVDYESSAAAEYPADYAESAQPQIDSAESNREYRASNDSYQTGHQDVRPDYAADGKYRQPRSILVLNEHVALVSTKLTGEIYTLDLQTHQCQVAYKDSAANFGKLVKLDDEVVAVADTRQDQLLVLQSIGSKWTVVARLPVGGFPHDIVWRADEQTLLATGKWSRRLFRWQLRPMPTSETGLSYSQWSEPEMVDLPMCGGQCLPLPKHRAILVTDAFGRDYAIVDNERFTIEHAGKLYGHNVTSLAATTDEEYVFFPHQLLNEYAKSVRNDITWGGLMSNNIRWLRTDRLLHERGEEVFKRGKFYPLGTPGNGGGDPTSMAVSSTGRLAITLGGTNRVAVDQIDDYYFRQAAVGLRPVDCAFSLDESQLLVVNQFSDSISVISLNDFEVQHVSLGPLREPSQVEYGEQAFFNSRLGHDGWMSCHSCHSEGHTNGQLNDNFSDKSYGTPKRVLSLLGQAKTMPYAWAGTMQSLEDQVRSSIVSTMGGSQPAEDTVQAIAAYVRSLPEPPAVLRARGIAGTAESSQARIRHGRQVFKHNGCTDCHAGRRYTSPDTFDVGLSDENAMRAFNPPSLIAVSQRQGALFHDGHANSLRDVLVVEKHQLSDDLSESDVQDLLYFLESL